MVYRPPRPRVGIRPAVSTCSATPFRHLLQPESRHATRRPPDQCRPDGAPPRRRARAASASPTDLRRARAANAEVWDVEGKRYIDFAGGIAVLNTGHCHPEIDRRGQGAARPLHPHLLPGAGLRALRRAGRAAERAGARATSQKKTLLPDAPAPRRSRTRSRSRAPSTGRSGVIAFSGGYHGRTLLTLGLTGKVAPYKTGFGPFPAEVFHALFPNALHGVSVADALASIESIFKNDIEPSRVAAFIIEPVQGEGGFYVAPPDFVAGLRALADTHGILLHRRRGADRRRPHRHLVRLRAVARRAGPDRDAPSRWPAAFRSPAVIGRADVMDAPAPGGLGGTYAGSPVGCAAALAVLDVFEDETPARAQPRRSARASARACSAIAADAPGDRRRARPRRDGRHRAVRRTATWREPDADADQARRRRSRAARADPAVVRHATATCMRVLVPLTASRRAARRGPGRSSPTASPRCVDGSAAQLGDRCGG